MSNQTPLKLASGIPTQFQSGDTIPSSMLPSSSVTDSTIGIIPADIEIQAQRVDITHRPVPLYAPVFSRIYSSRSFF